MYTRLLMGGTILFFIALQSATAQNNVSNKDSSQRRAPNNSDFFKRGGLQTIVLDVSDSGGIYIIDKWGDSISRKHRNRHAFQLYERKPFLFRIENVNALRYNYFLNDELITNFVEGASAVENNIYANAANAIKDIPALNIFNFDVFERRQPEKTEETTRLKQNIQRLKDDREVIQVKINAENTKLLQMHDYADYYKNLHSDNINNSTLRKKYPEISGILDIIDPLYDNLNDLDTRLLSKLWELQSNINITGNKNLQILLSYQILDSSLHCDFDLQSTKVKIAEVLIRLSNEIDTCNMALKVLEEISPARQSLYRIPHTNAVLPRPNSSLQSKIYDSLLRSYKELLDALKYPLTQLNSPSGIQAEENKLKAVEFITNKKNQLIELTVLAISLELGKLLEKKWIDYSRKKNVYLNKSWVDKSDLDSITATRNQISVIFNYAKRWIADFALISYSLEINSEIFKSVHQSITSNCLKFLGLLKELDHLNKSTITEFTSPIFHNQKNIDIVRFKVDRQDKLSGGKQTYIYDYWMKGGIKIDYSVGIFGSGLTDRKYNKLSYYGYDSSLTEPSTDSFYISRSEAGNVEFSFGGMVNISWRNGQSWFNGGLGLGLAYSANQRLQFLAAGNLHLGKTERVLLHFGVAMGSVKELDKTSIVLQEVPPESSHFPRQSYLVKGDSREMEVPLIERFKVRPFVGISYNLSGKPALKAVSSQSGFQFYNSQFTDK